jgi:transposase
MTNKRYPDEFKIEAVRQITDRGHSVADVSKRLDVSTHSLYAWVKKFGPDAKVNQSRNEEQAELKRLRKELQRVTEERDILKKAAAYFAKQSN